MVRGRSRMVRDACSNKQIQHPVNGEEVIKVLFVSINFLTNQFLNIDEHLNKVVFI
jgi:hypothetical protein